jgi:hypothetical protein
MSCKKQLSEYPNLSPGEGSQFLRIPLFLFSSSCAYPC